VRKRILEKPRKKREDGNSGKIKFSERAEVPEILSRGEKLLIQFPSLSSCFYIHQIINR
jgi:hypothetical protein